MRPVVPGKGGFGGRVGRGLGTRSVTASSRLPLRQHFAARFTGTCWRGKSRHMAPPSILLSSYNSCPPAFFWRFSRSPCSLFPTRELRNSIDKYPIHLPFFVFLIVLSLRCCWFRRAYLSVDRPHPVIAPLAYLNFLGYHRPRCCHIYFHSPRDYCF